MITPRHTTYSEANSKILEVWFNLQHNDLGGNSKGGGLQRLTVGFCAGGQEVRALQHVLGSRALCG